MIFEKFFNIENPVTQEQINLEILQNKKEIKNNLIIAFFGALIIVLYLVSFKFNFVGDIRKLSFFVPIVVSVGLIFIFGLVLAIDLSEKMAIYEPIHENRFDEMLKALNATPKGIKYKENILMQGRPFYLFELLHLRAYNGNDEILDNKINPPEEVVVNKQKLYKH